MSAWVRDQGGDDALVGDPEQIGMMFWASTHGAVVLELAGKLPIGAARQLHHALATTLAKGLHPAA
jgi:hypothetical protein